MVRIASPRKAIFTITAVCAMLALGAMVYGSLNGVTALIVGPPILMWVVVSFCIWRLRPRKVYPVDNSDA